jgi:hypothetical protein
MEAAEMKFIRSVEGVTLLILKEYIHNNDRENRAAE